ncbi:MAG: hypothetical protein Q4G42_06845 [Neisseria sp.]|nr:hypothetical protein [Neisseria sp.]
MARIELKIEEWAIKIFATRSAEDRSGLKQEINLSATDWFRERIARNMQQK